MGTDTNKASRRQTKAELNASAAKFAAQTDVVEAPVEHVIPDGMASIIADMMYDLESLQALGAQTDRIGQHMVLNVSRSFTIYVNTATNAQPQAAVHEMFEPITRKATLAFSTFTKRLRQDILGAPVTKASDKAESLDKDYNRRYRRYNADSTALLRAAKAFVAIAANTTEGLSQDKLWDDNAKSIIVPSAAFLPSHDDAVEQPYVFFDGDVADYVTLTGDDYTACTHRMVAGKKKRIPAGGSFTMANLIDVFWSAPDTLRGRKKASEPPVKGADQNKPGEVTAQERTKIIHNAGPLLTLHDLGGLFIPTKQNEENVNWLKTATLHDFDNDALALEALRSMHNLYSRITREDGEARKLAVIDAQPKPSVAPTGSTGTVVPLAKQVKAEPIVEPRATRSRRRA